MALALIFCAASIIAAQRPALPKQERLLNGLKVLMWPDASADKVTVKVRIHSGTAFDQQGKEGTMALLAESFFPNEASRDFFKDDLGGSLDITANYDYIQVNASARPDDFLTMLEAVATAVANPTIDKETTARLAAKRIEKIKQLDADPVYAADAAASKQLFGTFPYGRPEFGTVESVSALGFADLLDARQRFLTSDNATVSITGPVDTALAYRAARRYFGSWLKSDRLIPSTFKQPEDPDVRLVSVEGKTGNYTRFMFRGVARNEKDYAAAAVLSKILEGRLKENLPDAGLIKVANDAHILPGSFTIGITNGDPGSIPQNLITLLLSKPVDGKEFDPAKAAILSHRAKTAPDEFWLDADTFKLGAPSAEQKAIESVTLADVQRVADRLSKNPVVVVKVTSADKPASTEKPAAELP
ncbi:MAG: M16 family metallopeptidase [Pyrinomonadaceae bacterium]